MAGMSYLLKKIPQVGGWVKRKTHPHSQRTGAVETRRQRSAVLTNFFAVLTC